MAVVVDPLVVHRTISSPLHDGAGLGGAHHPAATVAASTTAAAAAAAALPGSDGGTGPGSGAPAVDSVEAVAAAGGGGGGGHLPVIAESDADGEPLEGGPAAGEVQVQPPLVVAPLHAAHPTVAPKPTLVLVAGGVSQVPSASGAHPPQGPPPLLSSSAHQPRPPLLLPLPLHAVGAGVGVDRSVSLARQGSYASFYHFEGLAGGASWARSNAFTRLVTIAAICNRAQFAYEGDDEGQGGEGAAAGGVPGHAGAAPVEVGGPAGEAGTSELGGESSRAPPAATQPLRGPNRPRKPKPEDAGHRGGTGGGGGGRGVPGAQPLSRYRGDTRRVLGDASEAALLRYVDSLIPILEIKLGYAVLHEVPFDSVTKSACAIARDPDTPGRHLLLLKGAPEKVRSPCRVLCSRARARRCAVVCSG